MNIIGFGIKKKQQVDAINQMTDLMKDCRFVNEPEKKGLKPFQKGRMAYQIIS